MKKVEIETDFIKLEQLIKWAGFTGSGGEAKILIQEGLVKLNGNIEIQRGKKVRDGDVVEFDGEVFQVKKTEV